MMSDAARVFWGSAIRHVLTILCTALIAHGYVSQSGAQAYVEEVTGLALNLAMLAWGQRAHYWALIEQIVARSLANASTKADVAAVVADLKKNNALPSAFTPPDAIATLTVPKPNGRP